MKKIKKRYILYAIILIFSPFILLFFSIFFNWFGTYIGPGEVADIKKINQISPTEEVTGDLSGQLKKRILFGDLHVHTTFSFDAFILNLPIAQGEGVHPVSDACNFARFCSGLDFFGVTDHAEGLTRREWLDSTKSLQQCSEISTNSGAEGVVPFLGWEWTQTSLDRSNHFGHKNIILKDLQTERIPARPISSNANQFNMFVDINPLFIMGATVLDFSNRQHYFNWRYKSLVASSLVSCKKGTNFFNTSECAEVANNPEELINKLKNLNTEVLIIPHGTSWGVTSPPLASWDIQLNSLNYDSNFSKLIEIYSGHGNSEEYRVWLPLEEQGSDFFNCPTPTQGFLPNCFQAGEIIRERCRVSAGSYDECSKRAQEARDNFVEASPFGILTVPGYEPKEWKDSGQCKDCFLPSFNYRPKMSAQYALAITDFSNGTPLRYRFGFIGSSDNHLARPGTGYKEKFRRLNSESRIDIENDSGRKFLNPRLSDPRLPRSEKVDASLIENITQPVESERSSSFLYTGGLVAVHSVSKNREDIWSALNSKEVYATSGERILLWFDLINHQSKKIFPMGSELNMTKEPIFKVRALGSQVQNIGCNEVYEGEKTKGILDRLCKGECFNPTDLRKNIDRIEVIRIRPQSYEGEPLEGLIEDHWKTFICEPSQEGCEVEFSDPQFSIGNREVVYYVRAIQEETDAINGSGLNCTKIDGKCTEINLCGEKGRQGDCLGSVQERAWSSPIFLNFSF